MDPISLIVGALAAGITAASQKVGGEVAENAYRTLKHLIVDRYKRSGAVAALEEDPSSSTQRKALEEALAKTSAGSDPEIVEKAKVLIQLLAKAPPEGLTAVGVNIGELEAMNARVGEIKVIGSGIGLRIDKAKLQGDLSLDNVTVRDPN